MKKSAAIASASLFGIALLALVESAKLPFGGINAPAPGFFPTVLSALLAIISLLALVVSLREENDGMLAAHLTWKKIFLTLGSLLAFALLLESIGYLLTTFIFVVFSLRAVERASWRLAVSVAFSASVISYVVFGLLLGSSLPAGLLRM